MAFFPMWALVIFWLYLFSFRLEHAAQIIWRPVFGGSISLVFWFDGFQLYTRF